MVAAARCFGNGKVGDCPVPGGSAVDEILEMGPVVNAALT
jgi:hypothetical protein